MRRGREAYRGKYENPIRELLGLSVFELDCMTPGETDLEMYEALLGLVMEASRQSLPEEVLRKKIMRLGQSAIRIARLIPSLARLLPESQNEDRIEPVSPEETSPEAGFGPSVLLDYREYPLMEMKQRATAFYEDMKRRRTVRHFSNRPVPLEIIKNCLRAAATAPSGANLQPWTFVVVTDPESKRRIREAAEQREREFYTGRATRKWVEDLEHLGTDENKPFLEIAPHLIVIFSQRYGLLSNGSKRKHYYVTESVGIATGILITALHYAGLVSLTYTPSRMGFLNEILGRPANEKPFMVLVVGYPEEDAEVPRIDRKGLDEVAEFV